MHGAHKAIEHAAGRLEVLTMDISTADLDSMINDAEMYASHGSENHEGTMLNEGSSKRRLVDGQGTSKAAQKRKRRREAAKEEEAELEYHRRREELLKRKRATAEDNPSTVALTKTDLRNLRRARKWAAMEQQEGLCPSKKAIEVVGSSIGELQFSIDMEEKLEIYCLCHLRPFGSIVYTHIPTEVSTSKLSPRLVKLVLLGYYDQTGYKLLDRATGAVYKSRDVIFEEAKPHYSTDAIVTYLYEDVLLPEDSLQPPIIAPRPKPISTLHPPAPSPPPTRPTIIEPSAEANKPATDSDDESVAVRRSRREIKPSSRLKESLEYLGRPTASLASVDDHLHIPQNFRDAMKQPEFWMELMMKELMVMREKEVFHLVPRPRGKNVVKSRWVYANKFDGDGSIVGQKARLVAKGFTQVLGEDYDETYASVAQLESVRLVCAVAASMGLRLWQVDFVSAFLNSENTFEVYMEQPPGFEEGGSNYVWLLLKSLYGTMQGAHDWARTLEFTYEGHGYYTSRADSQVRSRVDGDEFTLTSTWTDDILGASTTTAGEVKAKGELESSYDIKDLGTATFILGMKIERDEEDESVTLSQKAYCERILDCFNMKDSKPWSMPLPAGIVLSVEDSPKSQEEIQEMKKVPYREALGSLMWLQVATRPDLSFAVNLLSRFPHNPGQAHWNALKHALAYVKATMDYSITYHHNSSLQPFGYVDADYAGDIDGRRSTEGHIFFVSGGPVSWASKQQETVALSTVEAEYMAFTRATQQALWLDKFMYEIGLEQAKPTNIFAPQ